MANFCQWQFRHSFCSSSFRKSSAFNRDGFIACVHLQPSKEGCIKAARNSLQMIDLKRNSKKKPVKATGLRSRASSSYTPNQKTDFKISRGRFSNFLTCKRCFYLDRVKGLDATGTPGWTLNETTDLLLKKNLTIAEKSTKHIAFLHLMA